jgi:CheY-like chemotaxis protein
MKKLLIVDDEKEFLLLIGQRLEEAGFSVVAATDGRGAIHLAKSEHPDAIVLDIMLPDVDGINIEKALKEDPDTRNIPVIFISGLFTDEDAKEKGHVLEGKMFFAKPFKIEKLVNEINRIT